MHAKVFPNPRRLLLTAATAIFLIPLLAPAKSGIQNDDRLTGSWILVEHKVGGRPVPEDKKDPFFAYIFDAGGLMLSDGVRERRQWTQFAPGQKPSRARFLVPSGAFRNAIYRITDDGRLQFVFNRGRTASYPRTFDEDVLRRSEVRTLRPMTTAERVSFGKTGRREKAEAIAQFLARIGAEFTMTPYGRITGISLDDASALPEDLEGLGAFSELTHVSARNPSLKAANFRALKTRFPKIAFVPPALKFDENYTLLNLSANGLAYHESRRRRAELEPLPSERSTLRVLETSTGQRAFIVSHRRKQYVVHINNRKPKPPATATHPELKTPLKLGAIVVERFGYQIRALENKAPAEWTFAGIPAEAALFDDDQSVLVCTGKDVVPARIDVTRTRGNDRLIPGSPANWQDLLAILEISPEEDPARFAGCPVVDARTHYLVGVASWAFEDGAIKVTIDPVPDLFGVPERAAGFEGKTFFGIEKGAKNIKRLAGILPPDFLDIELGSRFAKLKQDRPRFLPLDLEEPLGRHYLLQNARFDPERTSLSGIRLTARRVPVHDKRALNLVSYLVSSFGKPSGMFANEVDDRRLRSIAFLWVVVPGEQQIYCELGLDRPQNIQYVILDVSMASPKGRSKPGHLGDVNVRRNTLRSLAEPYFSLLESLPKRPGPRSADGGITGKILGERSP